MLLPYTILVRIATIMDPVAYVPDENATLLTNLIYNIIDTPLVQSVVAIILVFFQAVIINRLVIKNRLGLQITLVSGMVYILLVSLLPSYTLLSPTLIANTFLLWTFSELFTLYNKSDSAVNIFNTGFSIGLATLLLPSWVCFLLLCFLALIIIKSYSLIDTVQGLVGFLTTIYLTYSIAFLCDIDISNESDKFYLAFNFYPLLDVFSYPYIFGLVEVVVTICIFGYNKNTIKKSVQSQKKIDILYWALLIGFVVVLVSNPLESHVAIVIAVPASMIITMRLLRVKSVVIQELLHFGLLSLIFYLQFVLF